MVSEDVSAEAPSPAPKEDNSIEAGPPAGPEALSQLFKQIPEIIEYFTCYLNAQLDRAKLSITKFLLGIALGVLAVAMVSALAFISIWLFFSGLANGLAEKLNHPSWLGNTIVGGLLLLSIGIAIKLTLVKIKRGSLKRKVKEYERQLHEQHSKFGHSAVEQAAASTEN